ADPGTHKDEDDAVVNVPLATLALTKTVLTDPDDVVAGEPVTWALDVRNLGPDDEAGPVTITDEIPAGVIADAAADLTVTGTGWSLDSYDAAASAITPAGISDRKSTRLNSSHVKISYAVFCLKKKRTN